MLYQNKKKKKRETQMRTSPLEKLIQLENYLLALKYHKNMLLNAFDGMFKYVNDQHRHNTRSANNNKIVLPQANTTNYGLNSITYKVAKDWNNVYDQVLKEIDYKNLSLNQITTILKMHCFRQ